MLVTFGFLEPPELIILLVIVLIIFGPGKIPDIGKALGKGMREFKQATANGVAKQAPGDAMVAGTGQERPENPEN